MASLPTSTPVRASGTAEDATPLYTPRDVEKTRTHSFKRRVNAKYNLSLDTYSDLLQWSTIASDAFWSEVWDEADVIGHKGTHVVDTSALPPDNPIWFAEAKLNWAENLLRCRSPEKTALIEASACSVRGVFSSIR